MERRLIFLICRENMKLQELEDFITALFDVITPESYMCHSYTNGRYRKYSQKKLTDVIQGEWNTRKDRMSLDWMWEQGYLLVARPRDAKLISICLSISEENFLALRSMVELFILRETVLAYEMDAKDHRIQNEKQINFMISMGEDPNEYPQKKGTIDMEIDIEKNPGYIFRTQNYELGACYRMWFGKEAYEILDKETLRNFPCYENVVLNNDVTRITLYENIQDYKKKENRDKQWEFRRALHIDEIAHRLLDEEKEERKRKADPEITIQQGNFEHGGVRLVQTYLKDGERVKRSQADSVEEQECTLDGKVVYRVVRKL